MADIVSPEDRSRMMSGIRGKNTKPELQLRKALHRLGFRYRLHDKKLPGKPDMVLSRYRAVIFVHGCFWHLHDCHLFKWPSTRPEFWKEKISGNKERDQKQVQDLRGAGWRVLVVWECAFRSKGKLPLEEIAELAASWIVGDEDFLEIQGHQVQN